MIHGWSWLYGLHLLFCFFVPGSYVRFGILFVDYLLILIFFVNAFLDLLWAGEEEICTGHLIWCF